MTAAATQTPAPKTRRQKFTDVYYQNIWNGTDSLSGTGSDLAQTSHLRKTLPALFRELGVKSIVDAPCGDLHWLKDVHLGVDYTGVDIVEDLVAKLSYAHGNRQPDGFSRRFVCADLVTDILPTADLVLCRDCLVHLPLAEVRTVLANITKSGAKWLLTTTFPNVADNKDVRWSGWRPLNLQIAPFNLPMPQLLLNEGCTEDGGAYADKSLGLWRADKLAW